MNSERIRRPPKHCSGNFFEIASSSDSSLDDSISWVDYVTDFYCREANLVIECDGLVHEHKEQWHHDQNRDAYMIGQGIRILRFANERILNDSEGVLEEIAKFLPSSSARRSR